MPARLMPSTTTNQQPLGSFAASQRILPNTANRTSPAYAMGASGRLCLNGAGAWISALVVAVVDTASDAVAGLVPVMATLFDGEKLKVGSAVAPTGLVRMEATSVTDPVKPPVGVMVMVVLLDVVAPALNVSAFAAAVMPGATTLTVVVPVADR